MLISVLVCFCIFNCDYVESTSIFVCSFAPNLTGISRGTFPGHFLAPLLANSWLCPWSWLWKISMDFNNLYGNRNECHLQMSYLPLYFTWDKTCRHCDDTTELRQRLLHVWHGMGQSLIDTAVEQWPTRLRARVSASGGKSENTSWLSIYFLYIFYEFYVSYHSFINIRLLILD